MVQHRYLGDVDKHEPYGIDDATDGEVFVADGNGGGDWSAVPSPIPHIHWKYVLNEDEADNYLLSTPDAWTKLTITLEERNTVSGASLSSSVMTLPAGTYYVRWFQHFWHEDSYITTRLQDTTAASTLAYGTGVTSIQTYYTGSGRLSVGEDIFTLTTSSALELQYFTSDTDNSVSFVGAVGAGFCLGTSVVIWKAA